jgi:hypothetical protein
MPISYRFDQAADLIRTRCTGDVTFQEVLDHFRELERDPSRPPRLDVLLDLTDMESLPDSGQLRVVASEIDDLGSKIQWGTWAIVANRDALFGMSRVFQVFAESHFAESRVFRDLDEAEGWLADRRRT